MQDVYLAPDPDREGEAIAWHTAEVLKKKGRRFHRVLFHELTERAIHAAMEAPLQLDVNKFESQQARRILDRLVGYQISPVLWKKVQRGLSAGRVQSVAVRIICERERQIQAFDPEEYWSITAEFEGNTPPRFPAKLTKKNGKKFLIPNERVANAALEDLKKADFVVEKVVKRAQKRKPLPPFTTSKLQQDAIRKLRFSAKKTMTVAQQLYEGLEMGPGEPVGLITYMRTDSTRIAQEAIDEARQLIEGEFGTKYLPSKPHRFKNSKKAQDAHEAIRPTSVFRKPTEVAQFLSKDQMALYDLIWKRFVASQMEPAEFDQTSITISAGPYAFQASGSVMRFPGFMTLYVSSNEGQNGAADKETLPPLSEKMALKCHNLDLKQHFTQPPSRFSEASLVKELEEKGIGRPSTYASILSTIRDKGYAEMLKGYFRPTELGLIVNDLLIKGFPDILNVDFTAQMEDNLDKIEEGRTDSKTVLEDFYRSFKQNLEKAENHMESVKGLGLSVDLLCPECNKPMKIKIGKNGPFLACSGYPDCSFTQNYTRNEKGQIVGTQPQKELPTDEICDKCGGPMVKKQGRFGPFLMATANGRSNPPGSTAPSRAAPANLCRDKPDGGSPFTDAADIRIVPLRSGTNRCPNLVPNVGPPLLEKGRQKRTDPISSASTRNVNTKSLWRKATAIRKTDGHVKSQILMAK
jgi:DNA topoisomerase-1